MDDISGCLLVIKDVRVLHCLKDSYINDGDKVRLLDNGEGYPPIGHTTLVVVHSDSDEGIIGEQCPICANCVEILAKSNIEE